MVVGAADVLLDCVASVGATEGFRAGVDASETSFFGGSFGGLRFSCVVFTGGFPLGCFGGSFAGFFFGCEGVGLDCASDSWGFDLGASLAGCFLGVSAFVCFAGCLAGLAGCFLGVSAGVSFAGCFAGSVLGADLSGALVDAFCWSVAAGLEAVAFAVELGVFLGCATVFCALLCAGEVLVFFGPNLGGFLFSGSDMAVAGVRWKMQCFSGFASRNFTGSSEVAGARDVITR